MSKIFKYLNGLQLNQTQYNELKELVVDLNWEYQRMSSSGQETLDKINKVLKIPTQEEVDTGYEVR
tara:strand:+ start:726 stop:923 length:198 start_codon:yes stop_codon:yes gene_type:complete